MLTSLTGREIGLFIIVLIQACYCIYLIHAHNDVTEKYNDLIDVYMREIGDKTR